MRSRLRRLQLSGNRSLQAVLTPTPAATPSPTAPASQADSGQIDTVRFIGQPVPVFRRLRAGRFQDQPETQHQHRPPLDRRSSPTGLGDRWTDFGPNTPNPVSVPGAVAASSATARAASALVPSPISGIKVRRPTSEPPDYPGFENRHSRVLCPFLRLTRLGQRLYTQQRLHVDPDLLVRQLRHHPDLHRRPGNAAVDRAPPFINPGVSNSANVAMVQGNETTSSPPTTTSISPSSASSKLHGPRSRLQRRHGRSISKPSFSTTTRSTPAISPSTAPWRISITVLNSVVGSAATPPTPPASSHLSRRSILYGDREPP